MELFIQNAYHFTIFNHFFNKRVFYGMKILALINLVHFYIILDTFIRFPQVIYHHILKGLNKALY